MFHADVSDYVQIVTIGHRGITAGPSFSFRSGGGNFWPTCGLAATTVVAVTAVGTIVSAATF